MQRLPELEGTVGASGFASGKWAGCSGNWGPSLELLEPNGPGFESCLYHLLCNFSKLNSCVCFLISEWELLYFSQRFCKMKWSPGISHTLRPTVVFSLFVNWFVLKYNNGCSCHKRSYVPEDLKYKITNYTLHFRHIFDVIFFTMPSYVFFLILLFLVVDQLIKSNEHLIETVELPLSACLTIFISVSIVKFMRLMLITNSGTCFFPFFMPFFLNDEYKMQFEFLK